MADLLAPLAVFGGLGLVLMVLRWAAVTMRRRGGGAVMGPFEEIWHPIAHTAHAEVRQQVERKVPKPAPGDP